MDELHRHLPTAMTEKRHKPEFFNSMGAESSRKIIKLPELKLPAASGKQTTSKNQTGTATPLCHKGKPPTPAPKTAGKHHTMGQRPKARCGERRQKESHPTTDMKVKVHLEYLLNTASRNVLWNAISTADGLETWFADKVTTTGDGLEFRWGKTEARKAKLLTQKSGSHIRFRWEDDADETHYFELRINTGEMTNDCVLEVTEFTEPENVDDLHELIDAQIDELRRSYGF